MATKKTTSNVPPGKKTSKSNKATKDKKEIVQWLSLLNEGKLSIEDVECFVDVIQSQPELGDYIQFELQKYCKKDIHETNTDLIVRLAELCFSEVSVSHFSNIDRFVGCVYFISRHLLKKEKFKPAMATVSSLMIRKNEILDYSKKSSDFLINLHTSLMSAVTNLALKIENCSDETYKTCHSLAMASLNVFKLTKTEQANAAKKVLRTAVNYLYIIKHFKEEDIVEFYQTLMNTFKIILPQMGRFNFFMYYFSKFNQFQKSELEKVARQALRKALSLLTIILNSSSTVKNILVKVLEFFWSGECTEKNWISDKEFKVLSEDPNKEFYFLFVSPVFNNGLQFLWEKFDKSWSESMSVGVVEKLWNTLLTVHKYLSGNRSFCCQSGKNSFEVCCVDFLTSNLHRIQYTVRLCLKSKLPNVLSLIPITREAFRLLIEFLGKMKSNCCQKQTTTSWKVSVIHLTNTVEDVCKYVTSEEGWRCLKECSSDVLREILGSDVELPFDIQRVKKLFERWHTSCLKLENYQQALFACVVYYVFYPKEEDDIISMWILTKKESANEIFQEKTMAEVLKTCDQNLRNFSKAYKSSNVCLKSALILELKAYSACLPDTFQNPDAPYNLSTRIWKQLEKMKLDLWESSTAVSSLILTSLVRESEKQSIPFEENCVKLIDALLSQGRKGEMKCRSLLHAANLTFSLFLYKMRSLEYTEGKMDSAKMVLGYLKKTEEEKVKLGEDVDLNLNCDVIPSSRHLTVELETEYYNELNRIVDMWGDALRCGANDIPPAPEFDVWLRNVKQVANMYEMFGEYRSALTTWLMFYRIGKLCNNSGASLLGLSHVIKNCSDVDASGLKVEAELLCERLGPEAAEKHVIVEYSIAMASNYLKNKKSDKCLEYLMRAKKTLESLSTSMKSLTLSAKFWCLVSQFLVVYTEYEEVFDLPVGTDIRVVALKAFRYVNRRGTSDLIKTATQPECADLVLAMFEVNLWLYQLHGIYRQTDFMRYCLDDLYQIVQRLFLPTRTAEILARLAEVDAISEKVSDCQEKVIKLKSILTTLSPSSVEIINLEKPTSPYLTVPQPGEIETTMNRSISPIRFSNRCPQPKDLDLSPIHLYLKDVETSKAEQHLQKCKCRLCQNFLIQTLTLNTAWLEGEIHKLNDDPKQASICYSQGCEVLKKLEPLAAEQSQILRLELTSVLKEDPGELDVAPGFVRFHCASFLIKFAYFELSLKLLTESVERSLKRVCLLMRRFNQEKKLLQWTVAELKLRWICMKKEAAKTPKKETPVLFNTASVEKTPVGDNKTPVTKKTVGKEKTLRVCAAESAMVVNESSSDVIDNSKTIQQEFNRPRRKLSFAQKAQEPKTAETVKKAPKERLSQIPSKKLDFDTSGDLFEDTPVSRTNARTEQKNNNRGGRTTTTTKTKKGEKTVKIYTDSNDDRKKPKKVQTKTRKV